MEPDPDPDLAKMLDPDPDSFESETLLNLCGNIFNFFPGGGTGRKSR